MNFSQVSGRRRRFRRHGTPIALSCMNIVLFITISSTFKAANSSYRSDFLSFNAGTVRTVMQTVVSVTEKLDELDLLSVAIVWTRCCQTQPSVLTVTAEGEPTVRAETTRFFFCFFLKNLKI